MKILFTKKLNLPTISEKLGNSFWCEDKAFIKIENQKISAFDVSDTTLLFTSCNGVQAFFENDFKIQDNKILVVGDKTEEALSQRGFKVAHKFHYASEMALFIKQNQPQTHHLHFCGNLSLNILEENEYYKKIPLYHTQLLYPKLTKKYNAVVFFSPSGVRSFAKFNSLEGIQVFAIGKTTEQELKNYTSNIITSPKTSLESILTEIVKLNQQ